MKKNIISAILLTTILLGFISCRSHPVQEPPIDPEVMVPLLVEMHLMDGYYTLQAPRTLDSIATTMRQSYQLLFDRYHVTEQDYQATLDYYYTHTDQYESLYNQVCDQLDQYQIQ